MAKDGIGNNLSSAARGFGSLPILKQIGLLIGLSASIAIGFSMVLWLQEPDYRPLYSNLSLASTSEVADELQQAGIKYKIDTTHGSVLVPADKLHLARLKLAANGLPKGGNVGFELLDKTTGIGTSRFMEDAQYKRALEGELAKTISTIQGVKSARVHLAIPKQSAFITDNISPKASVLVKLTSGQRLDKGQVAAIVQMVASSITGLKASDVSVADQHGNLLTNNADHNLSITKEEFTYQQELQKQYEDRIITLLTPIIGQNKIQARVSADIDFTQQETTQEKYNPEGNAVRSEQIVNEQNSASGAGGAPGAVANQAPGEGGGGAAGAGSKRDSTIKNYELGRSIEYTKNPVGKLKYLTIAVVIDDHAKIDEKTKKIVRTPLSKEELEKITNLVKHTVGFDEKRGDKISVINSTFAPPEEIEAMPPVPMWKQAWFWDIVKKSLGAIFVLILVLTVLRPILRSLAKKAPPGPALPQGGNANMLGGMSSTGMSMPNSSMQQNIPEQQNINVDHLSSAEIARLKNEQLDSLRNMVSQDPARVASVLRNWVGDK